MGRMLGRRVYILSENMKASFVPVSFFINGLNVGLNYLAKDVDISFWSRFAQRGIRVLNNLQSVYSEANILPLTRLAG